MISLLTSSGVLLSKAYNLDLNGRVMPHTAEDAITPHWSAPLSIALKSLGLLLAHAAAIYAAINHSHLQPPHLLPTLASSLLKSTGAAPVSVLPVLFAVATSTILPSLSTTPPWHGRVRELLVMHTVQEDSSMWWWAVAGLAAATFVVVLAPPPLAPFIEFWYVSLACTPASMHACRFLLACSINILGTRPVTNNTKRRRPQRCVL